MEESEDSILRIMITTDNHLGVWEKDEVRKNDSFQAFDEVLQKAVEFNVDLVLLGGDLFHENKPSRTSVVKAISCLKKHCLKKRPVLFEVLGDKTKNFVGGTVNIEDESLSVGLPVFTIHGNHDDPTGADNLSAVDILSSCGLVNYFGKVLISPGTTATTSTGNIDITPVLLHKGTTRVALYGLGSIREERMGRMFNTAGCVNWTRPASTPGPELDEWFNLFVLHQNRVQHGPQAKNCVLESKLPTWLDLIVWGHEHECKQDTEYARRDPSDAEDEVPQILQPGSTVATALSEGEAARKHCFLLEVLGNSWRIQKHALDSQRPFVFESVVLKDITRPAPLRAEDPDGITAFLEGKVTEMISKAVSDRQLAPGTSPMLPLIRLRVDYTGFTTINAQRFGQKFVNKVANPHDILTFTKAMPKRAKTEGAAMGRVDADLLRPEALDQARIEDLIQENLQDKLKLLKEEELGLALHNFVEKDEKSALAECVMSELDARLRGTATRKVLAVKTSDADLREQFAAAAIEDKYEKVSPRKATQAAQGADHTTVNGFDDEDVDMTEGAEEGASKARKASSKGAGTSKAAAATAGRGRGRGKAAAAAKPPAGAGRGKGGAGRQLGMLETFARHTQATQQPSLQQQEDYDPIEDDDDFVAQEEPAARPKARGRAAATTTRTQASPKKRAAAPKKQRTPDDDDEDEMMDGGGGGGAGGAGGSTRTPSRRVTRAQPPKKKARLDADDAAGLSDDDDEYDAIEDAVSSEDAIEDSDDDDDNSRGAAKAGKKGKASGAPVVGRKRAAPAPAKKTPVRAKKAAKPAPSTARAIPTETIDMISSDEEENRATANTNRQQQQQQPTGRGLSQAGGLTQQGLGAGRGLSQAGGLTQQGVGAGPPIKIGGRSLPGSMSGAPSANNTNTQKSNARGWGQAR